MLYLLYLIGLIFGIVLSKDYNFDIKSQEFSITHLISVFSITYFMFFVLYISKKTYLFYLLFPTIIFFRGFSLGVLVNALLVSNFIWCLLIVLIELFFIFSLFLNLISIFDEDCFALQPMYKLSKEDLSKWVDKVCEYIDKGINKVYAENALCRKAAASHSYACRCV